MSRIGKKPVPVGAAKVTVAGRKVTVEGAKGKLERTFNPLVTLAFDAANKQVVVGRADESRESGAQHGTARALIANMIEGVTNGYKKTLEIQGVGYKAEAKGKNLVLSVGFANPVTLSVPAGVDMKLEGVSKIHLSGTDKQAGGAVRQRHPPGPQARAVQGQGRPVRGREGQDQAGQGVRRGRCQVTVSVHATAATSVGNRRRPRLVRLWTSRRPRPFGCSGGSSAFATGCSGRPSGRG